MADLTQEELVRLVTARFTPGRFKGRQAMEKAATRGDAELSRDGSRVIQFYAQGNKQPSPLMQRALDVLMRKYWRIGPNALPASRWPRPTWTRR